MLAGVCLQVVWLSEGHTAGPTGVRLLPGVYPEVVRQGGAPGELLRAEATRPGPGVAVNPILMRQQSEIRVEPIPTFPALMAFLDVVAPSHVTP